MVQKIPAGYHSVVPHLQIRGANAAIDFYVKAFGATEVARMQMPGTDLLAHGEIRIGDSAVFVADEFEGMCPPNSPAALGGTTVSMHLWTEDADALYQRALDAGCKVMMPLGDAFWGDRYGVVTDPFGHNWSIATHIKDMTPEEMMEAAKAAMAQPQC